MKRYVVCELVVLSNAFISSCVKICQKHRMFANLSLWDPTFISVPQHNKPAFTLQRRGERRRKLPLLNQPYPIVQTYTIYYSGHVYSLRRNPQLPIIFPLSHIPSLYLCFRSPTALRFMPPSSSLLSLKLQWLRWTSPVVSAQVHPATCKYADVWGQTAVSSFAN